MSQWNLRKHIGVYFLRPLAVICTGPFLKLSFVLFYLGFNFQSHFLLPFAS